MTDDNLFLFEQTSPISRDTIPKTIKFSHGYNKNEEFYRIKLYREYAGYYFFSLKSPLFDLISSLTCFGLSGLLIYILGKDNSFPMFFILLGFFFFVLFVFIIDSKDHLIQHNRKPKLKEQISCSFEIKIYKSYISIISDFKKYDFFRDQNTEITYNTKSNTIHIKQGIVNTSYSLRGYDRFCFDNDDLYDDLKKKLFTDYITKIEKEQEFLMKLLNWYFQVPIQNVE